MDLPKSAGEILKDLDINEYELVVFLANRVKELLFGARPLVQTKEKDFIKIAFQELAEGKITYKRAEE